MRTLVVLVLLCGSSLALVNAQGNRRTVWSGTVGERQVVVEERFTPPFTDILVSVRVTAAGKTSTFDLSSAGRGPDLVASWAPNRLVLITAETASIVDLNSQLVIDQFLVARPSISPTGRFVAYSRFNPAGNQDEDVLLVYDVGSSVQLNRLPASASGMDFMRNVGLPVFPEWHTANQKYRGRSDASGAPAESLRSPIVWATETDFVFLSGRAVSSAESSLAINHVRVRGGGQPPVLRSQTIDTSKTIDVAGSNGPGPTAGASLSARDIKILDCAGDACQVRIEWAPAQGLRAQSLDVKF